MTQHPSQSEQATKQAAAYSSPTFQRPLSAGDAHQAAPQSAPQAQQATQMQQAPHGQPYQAAPLQAPAYAQTQAVAQPQPLSPGGQGPLGGRGAQAQPAPLHPNQAPVHAGPETPPIAADQRPERPNFPTAPSKVLAEQFARGGDGHIRQTQEGPAFDGPMLEGAYPQPEPQSAAREQTFMGEQTFSAPEPMPAYAPQPAPTAQETSVTSEAAAAPTVQAAQAAQAAPHGQPAQAERPSPRLQHAGDTTHRNQLAGLGEPNLSTAPAHHAAAATDSAFWGFEGGHTAAREDEDRGALWPVLILLAALFLIGTLAYGAWTTWTAWQSANAAPAQPVFVSAPSGPEWIVPENGQGLQIPGIGLSVLNPEAEIVDGELAPPPPAPEAVVGEGFVAQPDTSVAIAEAITPAIVTAAEANPALSDPNYRADMIRPDTRPTNVPAAFVAPAAPAPAPETAPAPAAPAPAPVAAAPATPAVVEAGLVNASPSGLYVQEGSYSSFALAKGAYAAIQAKLPVGVSPSYHKVNVNGRDFYRLYLTGWLDGPAARGFAPTLGRTQSTWRVVNG